MAHFAKLDANNIVTQVIVVADADSGGGNVGTENVGIDFCKNHCGDSSSIWKQTSYNQTFRGNYAGVGMTYMTGVRTLGVASTDVFISAGPPVDCPSWGISTMWAKYVSPIGDAPGLTTTQYADGKRYVWIEANYQADNTTGWAITDASLR